MDIQTIALFVACLLFAGFNLFANTKVYHDQWLKLLTLLFGLAGLAGAGYLLAVSFFSHVAG